MSSSATDASAGAFAVVVFWEDQHWQVGMLPAVLTEDLAGLIAAVQQQPGENGSFALVDIEDEFFVVVRQKMGQVSLLLSDVTAAVAWDLAVQVCDYLEVDVPAEDELEEILPAGDLAIFDDLGLDAMELGAILADDDAYADEMLAILARRLGFAAPFQDVVGAPAD